MFLIGTANASDDDDDRKCHPKYGCEPGPPGADGKDGEDGKDGRDGEDGADGRDGVDGMDGRDGIDGINGLDGRDGIDGMDGIVSTEWITETRYKFEKMNDYSAAMSSIQIHLPQNQRSRLTLGGATFNGSIGVGFGYAYKFDDGLALTFGVGTSGGEQVGLASVGFEFGAERVRSYDSRFDSMIKDVHMAGEQRSAENARLIEELRQQLKSHKSSTMECVSALDRAGEINKRIEEAFMDCLKK